MHFSTNRLDPSLCLSYTKKPLCIFGFIRVYFLDNGLCLAGCSYCCTMTLDLIPDGSFVISNKPICCCYTMSHVRYNRAGNKCIKGRLLFTPCCFHFPIYDRSCSTLQVLAFHSNRVSSLFQSNYIHARQRLTNPRRYPLATRLELIFSKPAIGKYNVNSVDSSIDIKDWIH